MRRSSSILVLAITFGASAAAGAQTVEQARDLYAEASYTEALSVLTKLESATRDSAPLRDIHQYRALCLLALGRQREAEEAIDRLVVADPTYSPDEVEAPPQIRTMFRAVRQRRLPLLVWETYTAAKQSFDRNDAAAAGQGFRAVLTLLQVPEAVAGLGSEAAADLRTLATSFHDLLLTRTPRAPPEAERPTPDATAALLQELAPVPQLPALTTIFDGAQTDVMAPVAIRQDFPSFPLNIWGGAPTRGLLEIVVDERGLVESAVLRRRMHPYYDNSLMAQTRNWRYNPAMRNGTPVKYRKLIEVIVAPR
jgi:tetratricopeptide (TPR) repeat protein